MKRNSLILLFLIFSVFINTHMSSATIECPICEKTEAPFVIYVSKCLSPKKCDRCTFSEHLDKFHPEHHLTVSDINTCPHCSDGGDITKHIQYRVVH